MRKHRQWILFFLMVSSVFALAQSCRGQGRMTGVVLDQNGKPLEGVKALLARVEKELK